MPDPCYSKSSAQQCSEQPSTSKTGEPVGNSTLEPCSEVDMEGEEDIVDLCRQLDTQLEEKAKMHNLNALNVKSILHRLIRDPHVLSTLMGIKGDTDDIPTVKVTRSKVKHSETAKVELKPVQPPLTFLDVQFENEDEDEDYRPEEVQSDESEDEEETNDTSTHDTEQIVHPNQTPEGDVEGSNEIIGETLMISDDVNNDNELSPYQLRSRVPHIEENCDFESLDSGFLHESFETFTDYHGQEMLTFVENPDYLSFLQGIQSSTPAHEVESVAVDEDDPDDEEYNVLMELDRLKEFEKDKDELRMDKFTEIPMREVEGLFLDLIGDDVETIRPELISLKSQTPKKKRTKKRRSDGELKTAEKANVPLPIDEPPPDGSYSCSLISGEPVTFKPEELAQLRIQLEQHVQLLTQSVVMCFHDDRLLHVKNEYQLMINSLDNYFYEGGESSLFNIYNLAGAIESCHDIMAVSKVDAEQVKWDPNPFGWSPRPEAALVLGRSRAIIYPDLIPGVQPDLFDCPHQFFTPGEDLLLAHALIQFRHIPQSTGHDPFGRLYWVQKMLLPCKTISQIRAHIRLARNHTEGQVNNRNPIYQIIVQALNGVCHLRFPFERPVARYDTLQMWPDEERPIWFNKFLKHFTTIGPTMIIPCVHNSKQTSSTATTYEITNPIVIEVVTKPEKRPTVAISSSSVFYEIDVVFHQSEESEETGVHARPYSYLYESAQLSIRNPQEEHECSSAQSDTFTSSQPCVAQGDAENLNLLRPTIKEDPEEDDLPQPTESSLVDSMEIEIPQQEIFLDSPSCSRVLNLNHSEELAASDLPDVCGIEAEYNVSESQKDSQTPKFLKCPESLQLPKSEFSVENELEEGEIVSAENSREATDVRNKGRGAKNNRERCSKSQTKFPETSNENGSKASTRKSSRHNPDRIHENTLEGALRTHGRSSAKPDKRDIRAQRRRKSSDCDWVPEKVQAQKRMKKDAHGTRKESLRRLSSRTQHRESSTLKSSRSIEKTCRSSDRKVVKKSKQPSETACCSLDTELVANERIEQVFKLIKSEVNAVIRLAASLSETPANSHNEAVMTTTPSESSVPPQLCRLHTPDRDVEPTSIARNDHGYDLEDRSLQPLEIPRGESVGADYSCTIPRTPTFGSPSNLSPLDTSDQLGASRSQSPISDFGIPATPRDDALTRSPTLLRAPSAISRALFAKVEIKNSADIKRNSAVTSELSTSWKSTWACENNDSTFFGESIESRPLSAFDDAGHSAEDVSRSKEMDDLDASGRTRMKRRTRTEKERMGLERMQNPHHRARQMQNLARKIVDDVRQRTFMHQDIWRTVEKIVLGDDNLEAQFDRLKAALLPKHADVLALLSLLTDDSILPPELLTSPLRRGYHGALQMLLAIEAYCNGTRSRSSNTRSLLKTIGTMGQTLSESDFCDRLSDLLSNERPLWNYIRQWLPLPYEESVTPADFEFIDLRKRTEAESAQDDGAECIDDMNAVLGILPPRKGGLLQVAGGQLNYLQNGSYVPVLVTKESEELGENKEPQEPLWTKEVDIMILKTYNSIDGNSEDVVKELAQKISYSPENIAKRLNFLLSLFQ